MKQCVRARGISFGDGRVTVQSMTNTDTADFDATIMQVGALKNAGCDLVRLAVRDEADIHVCRRIMDACAVPLAADIQFDYRLAVLSSEAGFSKIRINPGNIGGEKNVREVAAACKANGTVIRVGVNSGSIEKALLDRYGYSAEALGESALAAIGYLERCSFHEIVVSAKASDVAMNTAAYRYIAERCDYPIHIGVTESGTARAGLIKSAAGLGALLLLGIGDTLRVSLAGNPVEEVLAGHDILRAVGLERDYVELIVCPTCARCRYDVEGIALELTDKTRHIRKPVKVAVMGCAVNGPGEAKHADYGVCGAGEGRAALFVRGEIIKKVTEEEAVSELMRLIEAHVGE